jgi:hypothetical protein
LDIWGKPFPFWGCRCFSAVTVIAGSRIACATALLAVRGGGVERLAETKVMS